MKHVISILSCVAATVLIIVILMSISAKDLRQTELERALKTSAKQSLENACLSQNTHVYDNDSLTADFLKNFLGKMKTDGTVKSEDGRVYATDRSDPEQKLEIDIAAADVYKGILSVRVKENYSYPNGKIGTAEAATTQIVERESRRPTKTISYYIPWQVAKACGFDYVNDQDFLFYQKRYADGMDVDEAINEPVPDGYQFRGWKEKRTEDGSVQFIGRYIKGDTNG